MRRLGPEGVNGTRRPDRADIWRGARPEEDGRRRPDRARRLARRGGVQRGAIVLAILGRQGHAGRAHLDPHDRLRRRADRTAAIASRFGALTRTGPSSGHARRARRRHGRGLVGGAARHRARHPRAPRARPGRRSVLVIVFGGAAARRRCDGGPRRSAAARRAPASPTSLVKAAMAAAGLQSLVGARNGRARHPRAGRHLSHGAHARRPARPGIGDRHERICPSPRRAAAALRR